ncbi:hypothetical protein Tcan_13414 [Toxocara canis]|uniref:Uncharacterized protein n=2 Tax=Toxocara canis TaxID=6265 RepID=A0A0B2VAL9_TOXCA|nr:hypothetical protein Tcan_13414 [Toxocara canis]VDM37535.1 unnamed protein product [Toxocara canis]
MVLKLIVLALIAFLLPFKGVTGDLLSDLELLQSGQIPSRILANNREFLRGYNMHNLNMLASLSRYNSFMERHGDNFSPR